MYMNFQQKFIKYVIGIVTSRKEKMIELEKNKIKLPGKDIWETLDIIPLMPLLGANHRQPILNTSKRMVHCYYIYKSINQFEIGYMINPSLHFNNIFI